VGVQAMRHAHGEGSCGGLGGEEYVDGQQPWGSELWGMHVGREVEGLNGLWI